jgi:RNA 3'-terminal phosphate cyclase
MCHHVELALDPVEYPDQDAFVALVARLPSLGKVQCIELGIAPQGGGRLSFVVEDAGAAARFREKLRAIVADAAIRLCKARPA